MPLQPGSVSARNDSDRKSAPPVVDHKTVPLATLDVKPETKESSSVSAAATRRVAAAVGDEEGGLFIWPKGEPGRTTLFPIRHEEINEWRKLLERLRWTVEDVDLSEDARDWAALSDVERHPLRYTLGLFAVFDTLVLKHLPGIAEEVDCMEAARYYAAQEDQEVVHEEAYNLQIDAVARDDAERDWMLNAVVTMPGIAALAKWAEERLSLVNPKTGVANTLPMRVATFMIIEGVIFSAFFCIPQWMRERNRLPGITAFNEFIMRDEGKHALFSARVLAKWLRPQYRPSAAAMTALAREGVAIVAAMIDEAMPIALTGLTAKQLKTYTKFQADTALAAAGYKIEYGAKNPITFMEKLSLSESTKTNFFERRVTAYQGAAPGAARFTVMRGPIVW